MTITANKYVKALGALEMPVEILTEALEIYDSEPTFSPYSAGSVKRSVLLEALDELNYIRWLIGVPNNVKLNDEDRKSVV